MLGPGDPPPFESLNSQGTAPCLIVCDHASATIPAVLGELGVPGAQLTQHIAWDIGAAAIVRRLSASLNAPALLAGYSRLVVDCNRYLHDPAAFVQYTDGIDVPGNAAIADTEREQRAQEIYRPYHQAIEAALVRFEREDIVPVFVSVHTMTDRMRGDKRREQEFTLCWARDDRLVEPVLRCMRAKGVVVGNNQPYSLDLGEDYTVPEHAMRRGLAHLQIEIRQDLVADDDGAARWAGLLHECIADLVTDPGLRAARRYWP